MRVEAVVRRIDAVELRMRMLQQELDDLRAVVASGRVEGLTVPAEAPAPAPAPAPRVTVQPTVARSPEPVAPPSRTQPAVVAARQERWQMPDLESLLGARALAWAGGVVTLLGVVFLFVLAVNRGWIGPTERVALGALASVLVFGAGIEVRRRYGQLYAALGAVGAGIAGGYATLLAATALYELVPPYAALPFAVAIAAAGVAVALWWSAEMIAGLGLIGAMLSPVAIAIDDGITPLGTFFAAVVYAATMAVVIERRWDRVLVVGAVVSACEAGLLMIEAGDESSGWAVTVVAAFWLLYLATGVALHFRERTEPPPSLVTSFLLGSASFALIGSLALLDDEVWGVDREGLALLAAAAVYGALAAWLFRAWRDVSAVVAAIALTLGAIGLAFVLGGPSLTIAWAAEGVLLVWLARQVGEGRYRIAAVAYLGLAIGHALAFDAPVELLFEATAHPAEEAYSLLAIAAGAAGFAWFTRGWSAAPAVEDPSYLQAFGAWFDSLRREWRLAAVSVVPAALLYAAALALLELHVRVGGIEDWPWGHVSVAALWGAVGAVALVVGGSRGSVKLEVGGLVTSALALAMLQPETLGDEPRGWVAAVLAATLLAGCLAHRLLAPQRALAVVSLIGVGASSGLAAVAVVLLLEDEARGVGFLAAGAVYLALAAPVFARRERDGATMLWAPGLGLAIAGSLELLETNWLVLAWAAASAALGWIAMRFGERRLAVAAVGLVGAAAVYALFWLAPPVDLLEENATPATGAPAIAAVVLALVALVATARPFALEARDPLDEVVDRMHDRVRRAALWILGVLGVYAASLGVLAAFQESPAGVATDWQRGHTAVSAMWGLIGLALLYVGLRRSGRSMRLAGFALLGVSLAKIFLYDLSTLSSVARALSFLAVGVVFLVGAFFYQRLSGRDDQPGVA